MFKVIFNFYKKNKLGFIGIIGIIFTIISVGFTLYYRFYTPQPEISYTILSDSNVVDLHKPLKDLKILFRDEDIQKNNMNLKIYSLKISNSGKKNILETHYASDENWGIKITDGRIIESRLVESNSDYLKRNLNPKIVDDKTINFKKVIFDKNDYFTLEVLVLHPRDSDINLIPFGKISGVSNNHTFKKLDTTRGGMFQNLLTDYGVYIFTIFIFILATIILTNKIGESKRYLKILNTQIDLISGVLSTYTSQSKESMFMLIDLFRNDKIKEVLKNNPELLKKFEDCISTIELSINKRQEIEKKILKKQ
jgi:hypothetical protein